VALRIEMLQACCSFWGSALKRQQGSGESGDGMGCRTFMCSGRKLKTIKIEVSERVDDRSRTVSTHSIRM
jgi:hypothetical protein